ncbi:MAG: hypothetical protein ACKO9H_20465, partial [Planctomycetota bacterium]
FPRWIDLALARLDWLEFDCRETSGLKFQLARKLFQEEPVQWAEVKKAADRGPNNCCEQAV